MPAELECESRLNVAADGKRFRCDFIREGPVYYPEIKKGIECLRRGTIEAALQTFVGRPLTIEHIDPRLNVADAEIFAKHAVGKIDKVGRDAESGWFFCEGEITSEAGRTAALAMNPSCGFRVNDTGPGGRWNNVPYERELTGIEFHHLALTAKRPRYEEADFRLNAVVNPTGEITMFKFVKKILGANGAAATTQEAELAPDTVIKIGAKEFRLNDAVSAYEADEAAKALAAKKKLEDDAAAAAGGARENAITDETEVMVGGKPVKVAALRTAYEARENAVAEAAKKKKEDEARENAAGASDFAKLEAARNGGAAIRTDFPAQAGTLQEKMKRGNY